MSSWLKPVTNQLRMKLDKIIRLKIIWNEAFWLADSSRFSLVLQRDVHYSKPISYSEKAGQSKAWIFSQLELSEFRNGSKTCENRPHLISKISIRVDWLIYFVRLIQLVSRRNRKVVCDYRRRYQSVKFTKIDFLEIFFGLIEPNRIFTVWVKRFNLIRYLRSEFYGFPSR